MHPLGTIRDNYPRGQLYLAAVPVTSEGMIVCFVIEVDPTKEQSHSLFLF